MREKVRGEQRESDRGRNSERETVREKKKIERKMEI